MDEEKSGDEDTFIPPNTEASNSASDSARKTSSRRAI